MGLKESLSWLRECSQDEREANHEQQGQQATAKGLLVDAVLNF